MSVVKVDLDDYLDECIETIENAGYKVVKDQNFEGLSEYVAEMEKNLYIYIHIKSLRLMNRFMKI